MSGETENSSARSAIILMIVVIAVALYGTTFGLQTLQWIEAHRWANINPWLKDVPAAASTTSAAAATTNAELAAANSKLAKTDGALKATKLVAYNYEFNAPWTGKMTQQSLQGASEFRFDSGQVVVFSDPDAQLDTLQILRSSTSPDYAPFQSLVNDAGISTNYALYQAAYGASPAQFSPLMAYASAQRARTLLLTKLSFGFDLERDISSFDFGDNRGFQFGAPAAGPVALRVFNQRDKQFRFIFTVAVGSDGLITQDEIDQTVQSLQPVPLLQR